MNEKNNIEITEEVEKNKDKGNKNKKIIIGTISIIVIIIVGVLFFMINRKEGFRGTYWNENIIKFQEKYNEHLSNADGDDLDKFYDGLGIEYNDFYKPDSNEKFLSNDGTLNINIIENDKSKADSVEETYTMNENDMNDFNYNLNSIEQLGQFVCLNAIYESIIDGLDSTYEYPLHYEDYSKENKTGNSIYLTKKGYIKVILNFDENIEDEQYVRIEYINPKFSEYDVINNNY